MVNYPATLSECEIQCIIWKRLVKNEFLEPRLEVPAVVFDKEKEKNVIIRFDVVVFYKQTKTPLCIIEVKRDSVVVGKNIHSRKKLFKQRCKYDKYGIPVFFCFGENGISNAVNKVHIEKHKFEQEIDKLAQTKIIENIKNIL